MLNRFYPLVSTDANNILYAPDHSEFDTFFTDVLSGFEYFYLGDRKKETFVDCKKYSNLYQAHAFDIDTKYFGAVIVSKRDTLSFNKLVAYAKEHNKRILTFEYNKQIARVEYTLDFSNQVILPFPFHPLVEGDDLDYNVDRPFDLTIVSSIPDKAGEILQLIDQLKERGVKARQLTLKRSRVFVSYPSILDFFRLSRTTYIMDYGFVPMCYALLAGNGLAVHPEVRHDTIVDRQEFSIDQLYDCVENTKPLDNQGAVLNSYFDGILSAYMQLKAKLC